MPNNKSITPAQAVTLIRSKAQDVLNDLNIFLCQTFRIRGGRLGSGLGNLLEALWVCFMNQKLHQVAVGCEIGWLEDHEPNDFACVVQNTPWNSATRAGELFRIEAKSMNTKVDEPKGHFTELIGKIGEHDQLLILIWHWKEADEWRSYPEVTDCLLCPARPVAELRDLLHVARGGSFVEEGKCPDNCQETPCAHTGEPLNAKGKRERKSGPDATRPSNKVAFANNFGGLVRMLKTNNQKARRVFRKIRHTNDVAHKYICFIHRNFPDEEINQYTLNEWKKLATSVGLNHEGKKAEDILNELKSKCPRYQDLLRNLFHTG